VEGGRRRSRPRSGVKGRGGAPLDFDLAVEILRPPSAVHDALAHKERYAVHPDSPVVRL